MTFHFSAESTRLVHYRSTTKGRQYEAWIYGLFHKFREIRPGGRRYGYLNESVPEIRAFWPLRLAAKTSYTDTYYNFTDCADWEPDCAKPIGQVTTELEVEGRESLSVPAGEFDVYVIRRTRKMLGVASKNAQASWTRYWYAPAVGWYVKFAFHQNYQGKEKSWTFEAVDISWP